MASPRRQPLARFQLGLFDGSSPPTSPGAPVSAAAPSTLVLVEGPRALEGHRDVAGPRVPDATRVEGPRPLGAPSRTRALIDAINDQLPGARVVITDNRTVLLSQSTKDGLRTVRVHQMFLDAPASVRAAVAHYLAKGDRKSGDKVDAFVDAQGHLLEMTAKPLAKDAHKGRVHDLLPMYLALNDRYFGSEVDAELGWSQPGSPCRKKRRSITFGSWDTRAKRIVIHPVLDQRDVPTVCVERVLHHEMVHAKVGEERGAGGQRIVHGRRFAAEEARFTGAKEADAWFDQHLDALLRWRPGASLFGRRS